MDRELVLAVLMALTTGPLVLIGGLRQTHHDGSETRNARRLERACWHALWRPLVPAGVVLCAVVGWALVEPEDSELLPVTLLAAAVPFVAVWVRAAARAVIALVRRPHISIAATVGLVRPRVVLSPRFAQVIDASARDAVLAHERAHAAHRDPLRVWLAQLGADLQWPGREARNRLQRWRQALEIARDEEARRRGVDGADLAAAIIGALRFETASGQTPVSVVGDPSHVQDRIVRLLAPLADDSTDQALRAAVRLSALAGSLAAALLGASFGEAIVRALVSTLP